MGFSEESPKVFHGGGWGAAARPCESFEPAPPAAFGRHESAFLCAASDEERAHGSAAGERRRVRACEAAPATVTWGADAAYLTSACSSSTASAAAALPSFVVPNAAAADEASNDPWIIPTHDGVYDSEMASSTTGEFVVFSYANPFLDPMEASPAGEGLVPDRSAVLPPQMQTHYRGSESRLDADFSVSGVSPYGYASQIASRSLSPIDRLLALQVSPDVGVVPGDNSGAEFSYSLSNGSGDLNPSGEGPAVQLSGTEREAKVLRYREKRKSRRFEKTIRYASRKAYAEARPRVRGRFVKRAEDEEGDAADCFYISAAASAPSPPAEFDFAEFRYGVVPSR